MLQNWEQVVLSLSQLFTYSKGKQEEEGENAVPSQGSGHTPVTAAECAVPISAHTTGSWFKGADCAHVNTVASSTCSSGEGSSAELIRSKPSLLHLQRKKHGSELAESNIKSCLSIATAPATSRISQKCLLETLAPASMTDTGGVWGSCRQALSSHRSSFPLPVAPTSKNLVLHCEDHGGVDAADHPLCLMLCWDCYLLGGVMALQGTQPKPTWQEKHKAVSKNSFWDLPPRKAAKPKVQGPDVH